MQIRLSQESRRREQTPIENMFINEYMPSADGNAVKVYIYGLMQCLYPSMTDVPITDSLSMSIAEVTAAFVYWQSKGLIRILEDDPLSVEYLTAEQPALTTVTPGKYYNLIRAVNQMIAPRMLTDTQIQCVYDCIEVLKMDEKTVLELIGHCMEEKGKKVSFNYIFKTGKHWATIGILTQEKAVDYLRNRQIAMHGATTILQRWGINRLPTLDERQMYEKWINEWGFDEEAILAVCPRLTDTVRPSFAVLNDRLRVLYEQKKVKPEDIAADTASINDEQEFARTVFRSMGKVSTPTKDEARQLSVFVDGPDGLPREVVLFAAKECANADRPFGKLKTILKDWMGKRIRTVEEAKTALAERQSVPRRGDDRKWARKKNTLLNYAETDPSESKVERVSLDLDLL